MSNTMYFGVPGAISTIPCPDSEMGFANELDTDVTSLVSGGRSVYRAPTNYKTFNMSWRTNSENLRHLIDIYNGQFGSGPYYITDPTAKQVNILPARWSNAWQLAHQANGWCKPVVSAHTPPTTPDLTKYRTNKKVKFTQATSGATIPVEGILRTRHIRVPDVPYYLSVQGTATGGAAIRVRGFNTSTNAWALITTFTTFTGALTLVLAAGVTTYSMLELDIYMPLGSTLELVGMALGTEVFTAPGTIERTNLFTNPNMVSTGAVTDYVRNLFTNPSFETGVAGVTDAFLTTSTTTFAPALYVGAQAMQVVVESGATTFTFCEQRFACAEGLWTAFAANVRYSSGSQYVRQRITFYDAGALPIGTAFSGPIWAASSADGGDRHVFSALAPTGSVTARCYLYFYNDLAGTVAPTMGSTLFTDGWHGATGAAQTEAEYYVSEYFDGDSTDTEDFNYLWSGTAHASTSAKRVTAVVNASTVSGTGGATATYRSYDTPHGGLTCARSEWVRQGAAGSAGALHTQTIAGFTGDIYSCSIWVRSSVDKLIAFLFRIRNVSTPVGSVQTAYQTIPANTWVQFKAENVVATSSYTNIQAYMLINNSQTQMPGDTIDLDEAIMEAAGTVGDFFDGNTADQPNKFFYWTGAADASTSIQTDEGTYEYMPVGEGVGAVQFTGTQSASLVSAKIDRVGLSLDFTEVQNVESRSM